MREDRARLLSLSAGFGLLLWTYWLRGILPGESGDHYQIVESRSPYLAVSYANTTTPALYLSALTWRIRRLRKHGTLEGQPWKMCVISGFVVEFDCLHLLSLANNGKDKMLLRYVLYLRRNSRGICGLVPTAGCWLPCWGKRSLLTTFLTYSGTSALEFTRLLLRCLRKSFES